MIELNNLTRNLYFSNKISFKCAKENIWSSEIQRCYSRASSNVFAVSRRTSPRTFPRPVSRCEHPCDIHQRVINQSADILDLVRICGSAFKDHRASVIPWSARYPLSSNSVSILRLGLLRSSITNGCNCGADCVLNRLSRQSNSPYLLATVVAIVDEEKGSSVRAGWWNWTRQTPLKTFHPWNGWHEWTGMKRGRDSRGVIRGTDTKYVEKEDEVTKVDGGEDVNGTLH